MSKIALFDLIIEISQTRCKVPAKHSMLAGISGIDASGKGFVAKQIAENLEKKGFRVALINVDGWLNLPDLRFSDRNPGKHFYDHAIRLYELFEKLVMPLKERRSIDLTFDFAEETALSYRPRRLRFADVDIILLEGIFIFKKPFVEYFDLKIWIECSFETAINRAVSRGQEGLRRDETIHAYEKIYFPAQRIHFESDRPKAAADMIFDNN